MGEGWKVSDPFKDSAGLWCHWSFLRLHWLKYSYITLLLTYFSKVLQTSNQISDLACERLMTMESKLAF